MINTLCLYADSEEALSEKVELLLEQINNRGTNEFHNIGGWLYHAIIEDYQKDDFYTSGHKKAYGN